jgi:hypothetical protein
MRTDYRLTLALTESEKALFDRLQKRIEARQGISMPSTSIVRLAIRALAKQERVK